MARGKPVVATAHGGILDILRDGDNGLLISVDDVAGLVHAVVDMLASPMFVLTNVGGLLVALTVGNRTGASLEAVFLTFSYYATATRVMWEFNRVYCNLSSLTDAARLPSSCSSAERSGCRCPQPFRPADFGVELRDVDFQAARASRRC
jgi:ATP-binding cassette subfamily B protein